MYNVTLTNGERFIGMIRESTKNYIEFEINDFMYDQRVYKTILRRDILVMRKI